MRPLCVDLFCGLGGWAEGFISHDFWVVGFDIERHDYGTGGYPSDFVMQDVLTLHGSQFKNATCIVASPPCQAYSYRAMPWKRAKALPPPDNSLFEACFRIQREACEAAGRHIPMVVENVCGAQKWVGRAKWHFGSFYLWGDVPALMPVIPKKGSKVPGFQDFTRIAGRQSENGTKGTGGGWYGDYKEQKDSGRGAATRQTSSHSLARKAASAHIAKIPFPLAQHIARCFASA